LRRHALKHALLESRILFEEAAAHLNCFPLRSFYFRVRGRCDELSDITHPVCLPMDSSQYGLDLLLCSIGGRARASEADVNAELTAPAAESQSVADAEIAAALQQAAKEIGVV
ncbi:hypothetical protein M9458_018885, partial [Cirrhinus mrigala]